MWDKLGVCLVDAIVIQDCVRVFPEACKAWTIMLSALIDRLRSARKNFGFDLSLRATSPCLNRTTIMLNSVSLSRTMCPMDAKRSSSPCVSPLRRPNIESSVGSLKDENSQTSII
jgi:hypothetical protein